MRLIVGFDDVKVLKNGVGGAHIPLRFGNALAGRQNIEALVAFGAKEIPAALEMTDQ